MSFLFFHVALRPRRRDGLLGTGQCLDLLISSGTLWQCPQTTTLYTAAHRQVAGRQRPTGEKGWGNSGPVTRASCHSSPATHDTISFKGETCRCAYGPMFPSPNINPKPSYRVVDSSSDLQRSRGQCCNSSVGALGALCWKPCNRYRHCCILALKLDSDWSVCVAKLQGAKDTGRSVVYFSGTGCGEFMCVVVSGFVLQPLSQCINLIFTESRLADDADLVRAALLLLSF